MHSARHLMLIDICIKFCEYSLSGFQVIERTQFVTDRQMDRQTHRTDARGKTICLRTLKGGDIITHSHLEACYRGLVILLLNMIYAPSPDVIKLSSRSTQLNINFILLINFKMLTIVSTNLYHLPTS